MVANVSKQTAYAVLSPGDPLVSKFTAYAVLKTAGNVRMSMMALETLQGDTANVRSNFQVSEPLSGGNPVVRVPTFVLEVLFQVTEDEPVATLVLPTGSAIGAPLSSQGLRGLSWSTFKRPMFRTALSSAVSGKETRNARMQYPVYQFELTYEFLDQRDGNTDLETMMGFFMSNRGRFGEWLYQDPSDYIAHGVEIGIGDGAESAFYALKQIGTFRDPIGQFDLSALFAFNDTVVSIAEDSVIIPSHNLETGFGPLQLTTTASLPAGLALNTNYWLIKVDDNTLKFASSEANALAGTPVDLTSTGSGVQTASNSVAVYIDGTEQIPVSDYQVTNPNRIFFSIAPLAAEVITMDCKYNFVCRFEEDEHDYEQFMYNLWTLETMTFQSVIK